MIDKIIYSMQLFISVVTFILKLWWLWLSILISTFFVKKIIATLWNRKNKERISRLNNENKYEISKDWDGFPSPIPIVDRKVFFSGRTDLSKKLSDWITNSTGGSVLLSGVRGVGKTAFVYFSINKAFQKNQGDNTPFSKFIISCIPLPSASWLTKLINDICKVIYIFLLRIFSSYTSIVYVPVNAAVLEKINRSDLQNGNIPIVKEKEDKQLGNNQSIALLRLIIASAVFSPRGSGCNQNDFRSLYLDSIGSGTLSRKHTIFGDISISSLLTLRSILRYTVPITFIILMEAIILNPSIIITTSFLIALVAQLIFNIKLNYTYESEVNIKIRTNKLDYLFMKFNQILLKNNDKNYVFVIDEIDKLTDAKDKRIEFENLNELIRDLKNLFTISNGRFIFITSHTYANDLNKDRNNPNDPHSLSSTYYNWIIFLPHVNYDEIREYVYSICEQNAKSSIERLDEFAYYLLAKTGGLFSKIKEIIREHINIGKDSAPYLNLSDQNFNSYYKSMAVIGKCFSVVDDRYNDSSISNQRFNYFRHEALYAVFEDILNNSGTLIQRDNVASWCNLPNVVNKGYSNLDDEKQKKDVRDSIKDLLYLIRDRAIITSEQEKFANIIDKNTEKIEMSLNIEYQIDTSIDSIPNIYEGLTSAEGEYRSALIEIQNKLASYISILHFQSTSELLSMLDGGSDQIYNAALILDDTFGKTGQKKTSEFIRDRNNELKSLNSKINDEIKIIKGIIKLRYKGEIEILNVDEISNIFGKLDPDIVNVIRSEAIICKKAKTKARIYLEEFVSKRTRNTIYKLKNDQKLCVFTLSKKAIDILSKYGRFSSFKLIDLSNQFELDRDLLRIIEAFLQIKHFKIDDFTIKQIDSNPPSDNGSKLVLIDKDYILKSIEFTISSVSSHWRAGIILGKEIKPDTSGAGSIIHLYKDAGSNELKYRRCPGDKSEESSKDDISLGMNVAEKNNIRIEKDDSIRGMHYLIVYVNEIQKDRFKIDKTCLEKAYLRAWGDENLFEIQFRNIQGFLSARN